MAGLCAAMSVAGCAGSARTAVRPDVPAGFPHHTLAQIRQQLAQGDTLTAFRARASLSIHTSAQTARVSAELRQRRGDSLYVSVSPGLGIEAARMLVTPDSFFVYDRLKQRLLYGSLAYAEAVLPAPLSGDDVFLALLNLTQPEADVAWRVKAEGVYYTLRDPSGRRRYLVDPAVWRVARYEERTPDGALVEARTYSEYDAFDGRFLPRRILLQRPMDDTTLAIYYRDLSLNPPVLSFALRVGASVERVLVDETHGFSNE